MLSEAKFQNQHFSTQAVAFCVIATRTLEAGLLQSDMLNAYIPLFRYKIFLSDSNRIFT